MALRLKALHLKVMLSHNPKADFPDTEPVETIQSLKARLWNTTLSRGQKEQIRQQLNRMQVN
ncbi:hypothetical protein LCGC14_2307870 [marine sediment metagenome]|uniref:Uncharacterized protein n=1 Tax=marine sediment metagenome TaxID=412755 RepID=A0A0F9CM02_9ZZZZ